MDGVVNAAHDRAQHSAAAALATMGGPPASDSFPDLTGLSTNEVQTSLQFVKHNKAWLSTLLNRTSFVVSPKAARVCLSGCPFKGIYVCSPLKQKAHSFAHAS